MAVGVLGVDGTHALRRVALEHNTAVGTAINQDQHMEGRPVLDKIESQGGAVQILAQVHIHLTNDKLTYSYIL